MKSTIIYVVHHTNQGTPESNEIHGIYSTLESATFAMEAELSNSYDSSIEENEDEDCIYMWIGEHTLKG